MKKTTLIVILAILSATINAQIRNVIFMIGDGMGWDQVFAAAAANGGTLNVEQMPFSGSQKTYSANNFITDSAAGGTALATGHKTNNGMIGLLPDSSSIESILEQAKRNGMATGIVATCQVTHATPASYYAHQPSRKMTQEIALDFLKGNVDVMIAGGKNDFEKRKDGRNLSLELQKKGYQVVYDLEDIPKTKNSKILGLLADEELPKYTEGRGDYLPNAVETAINILKQDKKGFFLMVEGSQIDWGGHANDSEYNLTETQDFDRAIGKALDFARKDGHTLVIITADHETGGMSIVDGDFSKKEIKVKYNTKDHSAAYVPVFTFGPGAENFSGIIENTYHKNTIAKLLNLK